MNETQSPVTANQLVRPLPSLARVTAVRRLAQALIAYGHSDASATAIANAVCDPSAVRRQLDQPSEIRVADGFLQVIYTSVWAFATFLYPSNPRTLPAFAYPVADSASRRPPLPRESDSPSGSPELLLTVERTSLIGALDAEMGHLARSNPLDESIAEHGVREPLTLVPMVLRYEQAGTIETVTYTDVSVLACVDGSSRASAAYRILGIEASDAVAKLAGNARVLRQRVGEVLTLADSEAASLEEGDLAKIRALVLPAVVVIGYTADPGKATSLKAAIESRLSSLHIEPPQVWPVGSRHDLQADAVLSAMVSDGELEPVEGAWLSGNLTLDDALAADLPPRLDVRAARLLEVMRDHKRSANAALRRLSTRRSIRATDRTAVAVEAAIRPFRSDINDQRADSARSTLQAIWSMQTLSQPWSVCMATRTSGQVRDSALSELRDNGQVGPHIRELLILASYWLVRHNLIRKSTRGGDVDRRPITDVLALLITTEHGVLLLHRAILDGRSGRLPQAISEDGQALLAVDGTPLVATEQWIRRTWLGANGGSDGTSADGDASVNSPEADLARAEETVRRSIRAAEAATLELERPRHEGGEPLILGHGLAIEVADDLMRSLTLILGKLSSYRDIAARLKPVEEAEIDTETAQT